MRCASMMPSSARTRMARIGRLRRWVRLRRLSTAPVSRFRWTSSTSICVIPWSDTSMYQLCTLIAAREIRRDPTNGIRNEAWRQACQRRSENHRRDQVQSTLSDGLPEKDALVVRFGRAIFQNHMRSRPELYAKVVEVIRPTGDVRTNARLWAITPWPPSCCAPLTSTFLTRPTKLPAIKR